MAEPVNSLSVIDKCRRSRTPVNAALNCFKRLHVMLQDQFNRTVKYLRVSVTDRCDFRCVYCMAEEMVFVPREQLLTLEELSEITTAFVELGVNKVRITGGEPLVRRDIDQLFKNIGQLDGLDELTLTTNGSQLPKYVDSLVESGVKRINISLDSLDKDLFKELTRTGNLDHVLAGIDSAIDAGLHVKLNSVVLKNRNVGEVIDLVDYAVSKKIDISFIEEMPLGAIAEHSRDEEFISSEELRNIIEAKYDLEKLDTDTSNAGPSKYWGVHIKDDAVSSATDSTSTSSTATHSRVGFISPHSDNFCSTCNRVRLTATGQLLLCLGNEHSVDLKAVVRNYPNDSERLKQTIIDSMMIKPERHHFELSDEPEIIRFMNTTGG
jgi:cyclic pyranopterin phosphate synthase